MPSIKTITRYCCNVCNAEYSNREAAVDCEAKPVQSPKYVVGQVIVVKARGPFLEADQEYNAVIVGIGYRRTNNEHVPRYQVQFLGEAFSGSYGEEEVIRVVT